MTEIVPNPAQDIPRRDPETVMRLARMGSFHQCRLSFMRLLLRRMHNENWTVEKQVFDINEIGVGHAVYTAHGPDRSYSLVAFGHDLPPDQRSDRVIATAWDATFTLFDGIPTDADIERLRANIPLQEAGRVTERELSVSRANRSVRLFAHVIERLSDGQQPDAALIESVGYLMRTTAVYGSGKLGAADRETLCDRPEFQAPFQVEMLNVYLIRTFVLDLVEHMARLRSPETAVVIEPTTRRRLGIGNSTGLGMAPFLINHPMLLNNWIACREEALARVRSVAKPSTSEIEHFQKVLAGAQKNAALWTSEHPLQIEKLADLRSDLDQISDHLSGQDLTAYNPWNSLYLWAEETLSLEGQEALVSLLLEPYGEFVDGLAECLSDRAETNLRIDGSMTASDLRQILEREYDWALKIDWSKASADARAWYVSAEKLEPRLGERREEPIDDYEQPLSPGRDAARLYRDLPRDDTLIARFLIDHPEHRKTVKRAQILVRCPYAEIRDNTIAADMLPIDLLRAKLAFFGASHFDPRSDRWVRINLFQGAPFPHELAAEEPDAWAYPAP